MTGLPPPPVAVDPVDELVTTIGGAALGGAPRPRVTKRQATLLLLLVLGEVIVLGSLAGTTGRRLGPAPPVPTTGAPALFVPASRPADPLPRRRADDGALVLELSSAQTGDAAR